MGALQRNELSLTVALGEKYYFLFYSLFKHCFQKAFKCLPHIFQKINFFQKQLLTIDTYF